MARSRSIGNIYAELSVKDKMAHGINSATKKLAAFSKYAVAGSAAIGATVIAGLAAGTKHTLSMADDLVDVSTQTGIAIADMMRLQQAYKDGGRAASMTGKDIGKMQKTLVTAVGGGNDPFAALGLSASELINLDPADQFKQIGAAIMAIQNPAERTAKAMGIFGKGGMGLITVFEGLPAAERALGRMPAVAQQFGKAMGEANDIIGHLPLKSDQFFMGFTAGILGTIMPGLQQIDNFDFTNIGKDLGEAIAEGFQMITDGTILELMNLQVIKSFFGLRYLTEDLFGAVSEKTLETLDLADAKIAEINKRTADKFKKNQAAVSTGTDPNAFHPEDFAGTDITAPAANMYQDAEVRKTEVNDYQRRGLSLDSNGGGGIKTDVAKQTTMMQEMRDALLRMANSNPVATW